MDVPSIPFAELVIVVAFDDCKCAGPEIVRKNPQYLLLWGRSYYPSVFSSKFG